MARRPITPERPRSAEPKRTQDPAVILDVELRDGLLFLVIENVADHPVYNTKIAFKRDVVGMSGISLQKLPIWTKLRFLPAGKRIEVLVDRLTTFLDRDAGTLFGVEITYLAPDKSAYRAVITHDFKAYRGFPEVWISGISP